MARFCLRYQAVDLRVGSHEFVVGRAHDCDLVLDDTLVSRRHASFRVDRDAIELRDLESRNGVLLNGRRVEKAARLQHGDRVLVGSRELIVKDLDRTRPVRGTAELVRCGSCGGYVSSNLPTCTQCGTALELVEREEMPFDAPPTLMGGPSPALTPGATQRALGSFALLAQLADKAFGMGGHEEAERILSNALQAQLTRGTYDRETLIAASGYALRLAEALEKAMWLDYHCELFTVAGVLMSADLVDELYRVADKVRYGNPRALRAYVARMKADAAGFGANERFLLQRLEGLERRIANGSRA